MFEVQVGAHSLGSFVDLVGDERIDAIVTRADAVRRLIGSSTVWNVSSTGAGGGVAEMLRSTLRYVRGLGFDARWLVIAGPPEFFVVTKRLHNALHDAFGDGSPLGEAQAGLYERILADNVRELMRFMRAGDVVVCHDPQTAGIIPHLVDAGVRVVWRCHIGHESPGLELERGWAFLRRYLEHAPVTVFSRETFAPTWLPRAQVIVLPPNIDPFSVKNQWLSTLTVRSILVEARLVEDVADPGAAVFVRDDGTLGKVRRQADVIRSGAPPAWRTPLVVQVSRWDRMKDHLGVLAAFDRLVRTARDEGAELVLAGSDLDGVADDPEDAKVLGELERAWRALAPEVRRRVYVAQLPMADVDENAATVNALQRHAAVVVQKSLREGFGLRVIEAMWKRRPVVASAVGGIKDQIVDGVHGLLVSDPQDPEETSRAIERILKSPDFATRLGDAAWARVREH
jgi:trehalose synthase